MSPSTANHEVFYHPFLVFPNPAHLLANAGDPGSTPRLGRSPGEGNSNPLQYSCLRNSMDRRSWQATVHWGHKRVGHDLAVNSSPLLYSELSLWLLFTIRVGQVIRCNFWGWALRDLQLPPSLLGKLRLGSPLCCKEAKATPVKKISAMWGSTGESNI